MGKLLKLELIRQDALATFYFDDATYHDGRYTFKWPSEHFPGVVAIHEDRLDPTEANFSSRVAIRKWIEQTDGTVIFTTVDKSYNLYHTKAKEWDRMHRISNYWYQFWFEDEESALAFVLRFSDIVSPITDTHPTRHYEPSE